MQVTTIVPTVDVVGDEALTNSLINKTITELQDNAVKALTSRYSFEGCSALRKLVFGSVTGKVAQFVFNNLTALKTVDFYQNVSLENYSFANCAAFDTLILRSDTLCQNTGTMSFNGCGIKSDAGHIYVPAALVDTYKAAMNWSTYASQIRAIEDYPEVCDPYSWSSVATNIANGTYKSVYKVGDIVPLDLGSLGTLHMQVAAFDAEPLANGSGTAAISWVAKELLPGAGRRMNPNGTDDHQLGTGTFGGWEHSELRAYLTNTVLPLIPAEAAANIVAVAKMQDAYDTAGAKVTQTTSDAVWIPSQSEMSEAYAGLFPTAASRVKYLSALARAQDWWLRNCTSISYYGYVGDDGYFGNRGPASANYVCFGFCTGRTPK